MFVMLRCVVVWPGVGCGVVCGVVWCGVVWCGRCGGAWCGVVSGLGSGVVWLHVGLARRAVMLLWRRARVWRGLVLCGVAWPGMVWSGLGCGLEWCSRACACVCVCFSACVLAEGTL